MTRVGQDAWPKISQDYVFESVVGVGGWGIVYKAQHAPLNRHVAVKVLHAHFGPDQEVLARFTNEARVLSQLRSPFVAQVYSAGMTEDDRPYIAMEYLEGRTLSEILATKTLSEDEFATYFGQVCRGLNAVHEMGIVHRDLKPGNIMICDNGTKAKVLDFGLCKDLFAAQQLTQDGSTLGTPNYMSPEQCLGSTITPASDVYSVGCLMYESICGRPPFVATDAQDVMKAHIFDAPPLIAPTDSMSRTERFSGLVKRALDKNPGERPTAIEIAETLGNAEVRPLCNLQLVEKNDRAAVSTKPRANSAINPGIVWSCALIAVLCAVWLASVKPQREFEPIDFVISDARGLLLQHDRPQALHRLTAFARLKSTSAEQRIAIGKELLWMGSGEGAEAVLSRAIRNRTTRATAHAWRALARKSVGNETGANQDATAALYVASEKDRIAVRALVMAVTHRNGIQEATELIKRHPGDPTWWALRSMMLADLKQHRAALNDMTRSLEIDPAFPFGWQLRALFNAQLGQWSEAERDADMALSLFETPVLRKLSQDIKARTVQRP